MCVVLGLLYKLELANQYFRVKVLKIVSNVSGVIHSCFTFSIDGHVRAEKKEAGNICRSKWWLKIQSKGNTQYSTSRLPVELEDQKYEQVLAPDKKAQNK